MAKKNNEKETTKTEQSSSNKPIEIDVEDESYLLKKNKSKDSDKTEKK